MVPHCVNLWPQKWNACSNSSCSQSAPHTPALTSCNGTSWIDVGFSAEHYLWFWEVVYLLRWNQTESVSPSCTPWRYQFSKFSLATRSVSLNLWIIVVWYGWKCSRFVAFVQTTQSRQFCHVSRTSDSVGDVSDQHHFLFCIKPLLDQCVPSACSLTVWNGTCCSKPFHVGVICCPVWNRSMKQLRMNLWRFFYELCLAYVIHSLIDSFIHDVVCLTAGP